MNATNRDCKPLQRAEAQRGRILDAARQCFIEHGFHAATIANIAETAQVSAGLIYRYFENKSAIILAIVEEQLVLLREEISLNDRPELPQLMADNYARTCGAQRGMNAALLLEISAEATRDPQIAQALDDYDAAVRQALCEWLARNRKQGGQGLPKDVAPRRALVLQCLFEGLKLRETREPGLDRGLLLAALQEVVPGILEA